MSRGNFINFFFFFCGCSNRESELEKIYQEIEIMKECNHKYIVYLFGSFISERVLWVRKT